MAYNNKFTYFFVLFCFVLSSPNYGTAIISTISYSESKITCSDKVKTSTSDSTAINYKFLIDEGANHQPLQGAILTVSDPMQHGVVFRYHTDKEGAIELDVKPNQAYFIQVQKEGFEKLELKISFSELTSIKRLTLVSLLPENLYNFVIRNDGFITQTSSDILPLSETFQCWLYPRKQKSTQIVGFNKHILPSLGIFPILSF